MGLHKTNTRWLVHAWNTFVVRTSHWWPRTHKIHHSPNSREATTFPHIIYSTPIHEALIQMAFCLGTPKSKLPTLGLPQLWPLIILCADLRLRRGLNQSYSPRQELSNDMSHATCTQGNLINSWLLVVRSQIVNLTPDPSFGHNLCFECPNGSCEPILQI
jgi:hypothetical protein